MIRPEFHAWPKIARLNREIIITEKIDGTNAAVIIQPVTGEEALAASQDWVSTLIVDGQHYLVGAQSRKRVIYPGSDNFGFAAWVKRWAKELVETLGEGYHFGEWYGAGIQRGYGRQNGDKRFALFNVSRYGELVPGNVVGLEVVHTIYQGNYDQTAIEMSLDLLREQGSFHAVEGWQGQAEGIVVYHTHANTLFKVTLENDEISKGEAEARKVVAA